MSNLPTNFLLQLLDKNEEFKGVFGSKGSASGSMKGPNDVKCDKDGRFVVADTFNHRISWYDSVSGTADMLHQY